MNPLILSEKSTDACEGVIDQYVRTPGLIIRESCSILAARLTNPQRAYDKLKQALLELDFVRPGSVVKRFMPCGKPSCRCMGEPPRLHGPYYQWSYKLQGKTVTRRLTPAQAKLCEEWIENHRRLKDIVRKMETLSLKETDRLLRKRT